MFPTEKQREQTERQERQIVKKIRRLRNSTICCLQTGHPEKSINWLEGLEAKNLSEGLKTSSQES